MRKILKLLSNFKKTRRQTFMQFQFLVISKVSARRGQASIYKRRDSKHFMHQGMRDLLCKVKLQLYFPHSMQSKSHIVQLFNFSSVYKLQCSFTCCLVQKNMQTLFLPLQLSFFTSLIDRVLPCLLIGTYTLQIKAYSGPK